VFGRLYWYTCLPFHHFIFNKLLEALATDSQKPPMPPDASGQPTPPVADNAPPT
jgi:hypothetical protein